MGPAQAWRQHLPHPPMSPSQDLGSAWNPGPRHRQPRLGGWGRLGMVHHAAPAPADRETIRNKRLQLQRVQGPGIGLRGWVC